MDEESLYEKGLKKLKVNVISQGRIHDATEQKDLENFLAKSSNPEDALEQGRQIKTEAHKKWGGIKSDGKNLVSEKWVSNIMSNIQAFVAVGDFVMTKAPESVGAAWFGISLALSAIQNNYALYSMFGTGLTDVTEMMLTIRHYDSLYHQRNRPGVKLSDNSMKLFDDIANTYAAMLDFIFSVHRHLSGSGLAKIRHGFKDFFAANGKKFKDKATLMATCKAKVLEGTQGAFQEKTFQQFDDVRGALESIHSNITEMQKFQEDAEVLRQAQLEMQDEWIKTLSEVKESMKPRSRWDFAMQTFAEIKKRLRPLDQTTNPLFASLDRRLAGTCEWLFRQPTYAAWLESANSSTLCVTGQNGVGKSILAASVFEAVDRAVDDTTTVVLFFPCELVNGGGSDTSPKGLNALRNTLVFQLYELATRDENDPGLLEDCNKVFQSSKSHKPERTTKPRKQDETLPDLSEALVKLSSRLSKRLVIVLDAVDRLSAEDQILLQKSFTELLDLRSKPDDFRAHVRVFATCKPDAQFCKSFDRETMIDVEQLNRDDIRLKVDRELEGLGSWSDSDKTTAIDAVMKRAGPKFDYVTQVAIPFLKEPFRGSLLDRLEQLPRGIEETYEQALQTMQPNYLELLRCALSFALFSDGPVAVAEVMDAFSGIYQRNEESCTSMSSTGDVAWTRKALDIEVEQLKAAAGPFLDVWKSRDDEWMLELKDSAQVSSFFLDHNATTETNPQEHDSESVCVRCRSKIHSSKSMLFSRKEGHLRLALTCVRHLRSSEFWHRYYPREDEFTAAASTHNANEDSVAIPHLNVNSADGANNHDQADAEEKKSADHASTAVEDIEDEGSEGSEDPHNSDNSDNEDEQGEGEVEKDPGYDSDESKDDEDREAFTFTASQDTAQQVSNDFAPYKRQYRYEIEFWHSHISEAERLWLPSERAGHPLWQELMAELDSLAFNCPAQFSRLQRLQFLLEDIDTDDYPQWWTRQPWKPLHFASLLSLSSWAEHLIDSRHEELEAQCEDRTALQAASELDGDPEILKMLLEKGADPNFGSDMYMPACYSWIWTNPDYECMSLFKQHKADFSAIDEYNSWSSLHYFADEGEDIRVLDLLLSEDDKGRKPDINATDESGETPLHVLLHRRDISIDLLKAFIERGAQINIDDNDSERPLQEAVKYANEEIVSVLLPHVTQIDDADKHGRTALHQAAWDGSIKCVKLLLDKKYNGGANPQVADGHGRTPFFFACLGSLNKQSSSEETANFILQTLQQGGYSVADINKATIRGRTPLRQAASRGYREVVQALLDMLAEAGDESTQLINGADQLKNKTALHCAAFYGRVECVDLLLTHGADPSLTDKSDKTALQLSCDQWNLSADRAYEDIISSLIKADPAAAAADAELACAAAANGSVRLLRQLRDLQAKLDRPDRYGWTPLMLARRSGHQEAAECIDQAFLTQSDKLPSRWINVPSRLELSEDGLSLRHKLPNDRSRTCISTDRPIPSELTSFYFELTLKNADAAQPFTNIAIGFCTLGAAAITYPGWKPRPQAPTARSWGYHGDDGYMGASEQGHTMDSSRRYGPGTTVGCGVNFDSGEIWFTRDGVRLEEGFSEGVRGRMFPIVGLVDTIDLEANFGGRPFLWRSQETEGKERADAPGAGDGAVESAAEGTSTGA